MFCKNCLSKIFHKSFSVLKASDAGVKENDIFIGKKTIFKVLRNFFLKTVFIFFVCV